MRIPQYSGAWAGFLAGVWAAACTPTPPGRDAAAAADLAAGTPPVHVDSALTIEEEIRRFRAALPDSVTSLAGGARSIDELVAALVAGFEAGDRSRLRELAISPGEFIYLYYPSTRYVARPYEMSPSLLWFQFENYGSRGLSRALERHGDKPLRAVGHYCPEAPEQEGANRIWSGCVIRHINETGDTASIQLFGPILERDGHYKFINYANRL